MCDGEGTPMRLLPWTTPEGAPCYLSTDDPRSLLSRVADETEAALLVSAEEVLDHAGPLLADPHAGTRELRFTGARLAESLRDAVRIAESRGLRLPDGVRGRAGG
ncbi:hypothetical protein ACFPA8_25875 [Streptomyces ovatisporus]|uniref:Uncharacterized protein n=1 Tax=Streptomyces ovatisporus TaxID=1128682 RepID=A0ABV9AGL4_9ACTN